MDSPLDDLSDDEAYARLRQRGHDHDPAATLVRRRFDSAEDSAALAAALGYDDPLC